MAWTFRLLDEANWRESAWVTERLNWRGSQLSRRRRPSFGASCTVHAYCRFLCRYTKDQPVSGRGFSELAISPVGVETAGAVATAAGAAAGAGGAGSFMSMSSVSIAASRRLQTRRTIVSRAEFESRSLHAGSSSSSSLEFLCRLISNLVI